MRLQTWSITPRLSIKNVMFGMPSQILTGIDYYDATFHQTRGAFLGVPPDHIYDLSQKSLAGYWQHTVGLLPTTDFSYGARIRNTQLSARDRYDPRRPLAPCSSIAARRAFPLDQSETQYAVHVGLEHRFNNVFSVFGRAARAFRTPNVDERVSSGPAFGPPPFFLPISGNFGLKTQTSHDIEGGFRIKSGGFQMQTSIYTMDLENELHFNPGAVLQHQPRPDPAFRPRRPPPRIASATACWCVAASPSPTPCSARDSSPATTFRWCRPTPPAPASPGTSGRTTSCWMRPCAAGAALHGQRSGQHARRSGADATVDLKLSGADRSFLLVVHRRRCAQRAVLRLCDREHLHAGALLGLSAARPLLSVEGRRNVLRRAGRPRAGPACPLPETVFFPAKCRENAVSCLFHLRGRRGHDAGRRHTALLRREIADPGTQWSLGTFGAIAEFSRDEDEPAQVSMGKGCGLRSDRARRHCVEARSRETGRSHPRASTRPTGISASRCACRSRIAP